MDNLKFYYLLEVIPQVNPLFPGLNLSKEFPGMSQVIIGSEEYDTYDETSAECTAFLKTKLATLNKDGNHFRIFFEKNQFDKSQPLQGQWEDNEIVQIYISDTRETEYNVLFKARVFFINTFADNYYVFDAPTTLQ